MSTPQNLPAPQTLEEAQLRNQASQAEYYREKTADLVAARARHVRSEWTVSTYLSVFGQATAFAGILAALYATYSSNQHLSATRQDTAFFEVMKRLGDNDSTIVRVGAAPLLAERAMQEQYYEPVKLQLLHALLVEDHPVVLGAIQDAILALIRNKPGDLQPPLEVVLEKVQVQILEPLAALTLDPAGEVPDDVSNEQWSDVRALVPLAELTQEDLTTLISEERHAKYFGELQKSAARRRMKMSEDQWREFMDAQSREFRAAATRLRLVENLLTHCRKTD